MRTTLPPRKMGNDLRPTIFSVTPPREKNTRRKRRRRRRAKERRKKERKMLSLTAQSPTFRQPSPSLAAATPSSFLQARGSLKMPDAHNPAYRLTSTTRRKGHLIRLTMSAGSDAASVSASPETPKPSIELEFIGGKAGPDGSYPVQKAAAVSGEKVLRNLMLEHKIDLYAAYGKVMNCGGGGSCGTCIVEILDGEELLSERTNTELRYLKKKPDSWRLACQTIVGNKTNSGKVIVQCKPQWKK